MSKARQMHEAQRWLTTATEDAGAAEALRQSGHFAQSCFLWQQAAEKALKAIWHALDEDPWGHSIQRLIADFSSQDQLNNPDALTKAAARLDRLYIATRYPNGIPDLTPGQTYMAEDADRAKTDAQAIINEATRILQTLTE